MTAMNGFQLAGKELKVGIATSDMQLGGESGGASGALAIGGGQSELDEDARKDGPGAQGGGMLKDANDRLALMQKLQRDPVGGAPTMMPPAGSPMGAVGGGMPMGGPRPLAPMGGVAGMGGGMGGMGGGMGMPQVGMPAQNPALNMPSNIIVLHGMFNPAQVNLAADPEFFNDIHADVEQECRKYGSVMTVWADKRSSRGDVWVRFADTGSAANCQRALDRRWFAGQQIIAEFTSEAAWNATVKY
mmetsp:Transcript_4631/g.11620  ORF Transcript_4631/g.11620 Transcript_4631/m.11620 type:complete len:245 (-) Transcript_4631:119-853(-)